MAKLLVSVNTSLERSVIREDCLTLSLGGRQVLPGLALRDGLEMETLCRMSLQGTGFGEPQES